MRAMGTSVKVVRKLANILSYFFVSGSVCGVPPVILSFFTVLSLLPVFLFSHHSAWVLYHHDFRRDPVISRP